MKKDFVSAESGNEKNRRRAKVRHLLATTQLSDEEIARAVGSYPKAVRLTRFNLLRAGKLGPDGFAWPTKPEPHMNMVSELGLQRSPDLTHDNVTASRKAAPAIQTQPERPQGAGPDGREAPNSEATPEPAIKPTAEQAEHDNVMARVTRLENIIKEGGRVVALSEEEMQKFADDASGGVQKQLDVVATPLIKKVILNPKIFMYYDYAKTQFGFKGDFGDFVRDCVEYFFLRHGFSIKITRELS